MTDQNTAQTPLPKRRGLGRGLDALFDDTELRVAAPNVDAASSNAVALPPGRGAQTPTPPMLSGGRVMLPITLLQPGAYQPRRRFDEAALHELAQSIAQHGIIQPLLVRPFDDGNEPKGRYEIIAGERRWRAAAMAGVHDVPVVVQPMTDREALQLGLIENVQRQDLNAIEEAEGYQRLINEFSFSAEKLGEMIGKSRSHVANTLRLLQLPETVRTHVVAGRLTAGHARALIGCAAADALAQQAIDKKLSVRDVERLVRKASVQHDRIIQAGKDLARAIETGMEPELRALEKRLTDAMGLKVAIKLNDPDGQTGGHVVIDFKNNDQLDLVIKRVTGDV
jgi:ParB family chromosome partitioning protein